MSMETKIGDTVVEFDGTLPQIGQEAPDFRYVSGDFKEKKLSDHRGEKVVILSMPSLDTGVCGMETRTFNKRLADKGVTTLLMTMDLPFAMKRFCEAEGIDKCHPASDFKHRDFASNYHLIMQNGPIAGVFARTVIVVNEEGVIDYIQMVPSIGDEPDYEAAIAALGT